MGTIKELLEEHRSTHRHGKDYTCEDCEFKGTIFDVRDHVVNSNHMKFRLPPPPAYNDAKSGPAERKLYDFFASYLSIISRYLSS